MRFAAVLILLALCAGSAHARPPFYIVMPKARGGSDSKTAADSISSLADSTAKAMSLGRANQLAAAGRTFVILPGDYSGETGVSTYPSKIAPQAAGTGLNPDSSIRYISSDVYATGSTASPRNFTVAGTEISKRYVMVTGIETSGYASITRQSGLVGSQFDSLSYCYLAGVGIYGVNTGVIYGGTIRRLQVGQGAGAESLIEYMGENSGCGRTCSYQASDWTIRRVTIQADSVRQNGKLFKLIGRGTRLLVDSCTVTGLLVSKPALGLIGNLATGVWAAGSDGATFADNRWTLDMLNGGGCTGCNTNENITDFYVFYLRDSANHVTWTRDTFNLSIGTASKSGTGIRAHWSAVGSSVGPMNHNQWIDCVFRGEFDDDGWDISYQIDDCTWRGNSFFADSGGTPFLVSGMLGENNRFERNTVVTRQSPAIILEGSARSTVVRKNKILENVFVRMNTSRASTGSALNKGVAVFLQGPLNVPHAYAVDRNLYYSYTGAVSQAVGWASSIGSCVGRLFEPGCKDSCGTMPDPSPKCWSDASNDVYDYYSRWGDPLFTDTTAAGFSGNIRCYHPTTGTRSAVYGVIPDSAVGARQPQGLHADPREPYAYVTDSLGVQLVVDTISTSTNTITFKFKAPPDHSVSLTGTPNSYLCAISEQPITAANFGQATHVTPPAVAAPGTTVSFTISAVQHRVYYTAVKTIGSCGRLSPEVSANGCAVARGSLVLCP